MAQFSLLLSLISLLILPIAVISPHLIFRKKNHSSLTAGLIFLAITVISFTTAEFNFLFDSTKAVLSESTEALSPNPSVEITPSGTETNLHKVTKIIDGDTIELATGEKVRYIGIDTPETVDPRKPVMCFGREATNKNIEYVLGKSVRLEKDVSDKDRFGRLLRYVYIGSDMVNETLVREGFAYSVSFPPDIKFQHIFNDAQSLATINKKGLWGSICDNLRVPSPTINAKPKK